MQAQSSVLAKNLKQLVPGQAYTNNSGVPLEILAASNEGPYNSKIDKNRMKKPKSVRMFHNGPFTKY